MLQCENNLFYYSDYRFKRYSQERNPCEALFFHENTYLIILLCEKVDILFYPRTMTNFL